MKLSDSRYGTGQDPVIRALWALLITITIVVLVGGIWALTR